MKQNNEGREWLDEQLSKRKDSKWLRYSSQIARRILAVIRDNKDVTQKKLANKIGVTPQYISKILKGQENLTLETISKLTDALGVELITFPHYRYSTIPSFLNSKNADLALTTAAFDVATSSTRSINLSTPPFTVIRGNLAKAEKHVHLTEAV